MRMWVAVGAAGAVLLALAPETRGQMEGDREVAERAAVTITVGDLERHMGVLAHDSMRGRDTPSPELMETARYIGQQFASFGLSPGAGDGFLQLYPLTRFREGPEDAHHLILRGPEGEHRLAYGKEYFVEHSLGRIEAAGELVHVESMSRMGDASGQVALITATTGNVRQVFGGGMSKSIDAARPAGVLVVVDVPQQYFDRLREIRSGERAVFGELEGSGVPVLVVAQSALPASLARATARGEPTDGWTAEMATASEVDIAEAPNAIGVLVGSDPELRDEYVLFTAHMDHVGVDRPVDGDSVYNGADDNASGTVTVIELAEAFASLDSPPRRSLIFMAVSGEEDGLLGSRWYVEHPTFPLEKTVANINLDMVGRNWPDTIVAVGKNQSSLGPLVESLAAGHPELDMAIIDDPWPEEGFYTRADHYNFARRGVPILFFFSGTHADYHRPSDEADRIDYEKMSRVGRLLFYLGLEVANADARPIWDPEAYERVVGKPRT